jgi:phenylacetate-CoA ligase
VIPAFARLLYHAGQAYRGEPVGAVLRELEASQRWSLDRLMELQWQRQVTIARHAYETVPIYRERWQAAGITPEALRTRDEWARIPPIEKHEVRAAGERIRSSRALPGHKATTSGTSGTPVAVVRSHLSWAHAHANVFRGWHWHGLEIGDPYAYFWGLALDESGRRQAAIRDWFFNRRRISAFDITPESARAFYRRLRSPKARFGFGYPSAATQFAEEVAALGLDGTALGFKAVITTAEVLKPHQRDRLESTFGCRAVDSYGCAEVGVTGFQCESGGMHVPIESVVVDLVPIEGGAHEVLLTDLHNFTEPIVRYRIGDYVGEAPASCPCGRALPLLGPIQGRSGDNITLPDGRVINGLLPYYIFRHHAKSQKVREYQFVQFQDGRVELRVLPGPSWSHEAGPEIEAEVTRGLGLPVRLRLVTKIHRVGRGKHRDFVKAEDLPD